MNLNHYILSLVIWLPIVGGFIVLAAGGKHDSHAAKWLALVFSVLTFLICLHLYIAFDVTNGSMQFVESVPWLPLVNSNYALGIDGISLLFILLTSFTTVVIVLAGWKSIEKKIPQYMAIFLITAGVTNGVFAATDSLVFYLFWEAALIPMTLGIGIWGGSQRAKAAIKFFLFTFFGSIFLLVTICYFHARTGSFSISDIYSLVFSEKEQWFLFIAFFLAFAVKIPMWPFHSWLPDAHTEAPAGGSVILAALMLKLGAYGFLRFALPIIPDIHESLDWLLIALSLVGIIYIGLVAVVQKDAKRLIAYSSISHMGLVTLGMFSVFMILSKTGSSFDASLAVQGAVYQMIAHAFSSGGLFIGIGYLYSRMRTRTISDFGGVAKSMPVFAAFFMLFAMANVGLPGTSGFVGEFMILLAIFKASPLLALLAGLTVVLAPAYTLWMYKSVFFGEVKSEGVAGLEDIKGMEIGVFTLLAIPTILFGIYPEPIIQLSQAASNSFIHALIR
jgi:NADH-quinone oxidoreductase subunit M